jgi:hypothetical protein
MQIDKQQIILQLARQSNPRAVRLARPDGHRAGLREARQRPSELLGGIGDKQVVPTKRGDRAPSPAAGQRPSISGLWLLRPFNAFRHRIGIYVASAIRPGSPAE